MALVKQSTTLESVQLTFDADGNLSAVHLNRTWALTDDAKLDANGKPTTLASGIRDAPDVWPLLSPTQKSTLNTLAKRLAVLSDQV